MQTTVGTSLILGFLAVIAGCALPIAKETTSQPTEDDTAWAHCRNEFKKQIEIDAEETKIAWGTLSYLEAKATMWQTISDAVHFQMETLETKCLLYYRDKEITAAAYLEALKQIDAEVSVLNLRIFDVMAEEDADSPQLKNENEVARRELTRAQRVSDAARAEIRKITSMVETDAEAVSPDPNFAMMNSKSEADYSILKQIMALSLEVKKIQDASGEIVSDYQQRIMDLESKLATVSARLKTSESNYIGVKDKVCEIASSLDDPRLWSICKQ